MHILYTVLKWRKILFQYGVSYSKRPPPVGEHLALTFWVFIYGRFDCSLICSLQMLRAETQKALLKPIIGEQLYCYNACLACSVVQTIVVTY